MILIKVLFKLIMTLALFALRNYVENFLYCLKVPKIFKTYFFCIKYYFIKTSANFIIYLFETTSRILCESMNPWWVRKTWILILSRISEVALDNKETAKMIINHLPIENISWGLSEWNSYNAPPSRGGRARTYKYYKLFSSICNIHLS